MCVQCWSAAVASVGAASGARAWISAKAGVWLTPKRKKALTITLMGMAVIAAGLGLGGTGA